MKDVQELGTFSIVKKNQVTFHSYMSPENGQFVCSHIVETANRLVVVDTLLLRPHAQVLRRYVDGLNKPVDRVIITHFHPDHWLGSEFFKDVPIYAQKPTRDALEQYGDMFVKTKKELYGDLSASEKVVPTDIIEEGATTIDGLRYVFTDIKDAEAKLMLLIELPDVKTVIAQDLVYNHIYLFLGERTATGDYCINNWIGVLKSLLDKEYELVLPGHGEPSDSSVIAENIAYLEMGREFLESTKDEQELKQLFLKQYPDYRGPELLDITNFFLFHKNW